MKNKAIELALNAVMARDSGWTPNKPRCKACQIESNDEQVKQMPEHTCEKGLLLPTVEPEIQQTFTLEDMRAAFYAGKDHTADEYRDGEAIGFDEWIKTRKP